MRLQLAACLGDLGEEFFVFGQEVIDIAGTRIGIMWIFEIGVEVAGFDLVDGDRPGLLVFHPGCKAVAFLSPPGTPGFEFLDADRLALVVALGTSRIWVIKSQLLLTRAGVMNFVRISALVRSFIFKLPEVAAAISSE